MCLSSIVCTSHVTVKSYKVKINVIIRLSKFYLLLKNVLSRLFYTIKQLCTAVFINNMLENECTNLSVVLFMDKYSLLTKIYKYWNQHSTAKEINMRVFAHMNIPHMKCYWLHNDWWHRIVTCHIIWIERENALYNHRVKTKQNILSLNSKKNHHRIII